MSISEDEDDFLSADEGGFEEEKKKPASVVKSKDLSYKVDTFKEYENKNLPVDDDDNVIKNVDAKNSVCKTKTESRSSVRQDENDSKMIDKDDCVASGHKEKNAEEDDVEEEEDIAERIRERNLRIARKFSAEIAKNIKTYAPGPCKSSEPISIKDMGSKNIPDSRIKSGLPPAPPPTPALSSSYNSEEPSALGGQYNWRVPTKINTTPTNNDPSSDSAKINQARFALDRLSENFGSQEKNLFERVAEDLKKVSIRSEEPTSCNSEQSNSSNIPIISDLSSSLGAWNWGGASKLLASATQVSSQVKSVFDSVLQQPANNQDSATPRIDRKDS